MNADAPKPNYRRSTFALVRVGDTIRDVFGNVTTITSIDTVREFGKTRYCLEGVRDGMPVTGFGGFGSHKVEIAR